MKIEKRSLQFNHLLTYETELQRKDWQEGIFVLDDIQLGLELYKNGPIFFQAKSKEENSDNLIFTYYLPLNEEVELEDGASVDYIPQLKVEEALVLRQADQEVDFHAAYQRIKDYAQDNSEEIEDTYYVVLIEVYGEIIIDLYVPLKRRSFLR